MSCPIYRNAVSSPTAHKRHLPVALSDRWGLIEADLHAIRDSSRGGRQGEVGKANKGDMTGTSRWISKP